jgi:hypothetical protein
MEKFDGFPSPNKIKPSYQSVMKDEDVVALNQGLADLQVQMESN